MQNIKYDRNDLKHSLWVKIKILLSILDLFAKTEK